MIPHNFQIVDNIDPTCIKKGNQNLICDFCFKRSKIEIDMILKDNFSGKIHLLIFLEHPVEGFLKQRNPGDRKILVELPVRVGGIVLADPSALRHEDSVADRGPVSAVAGDIRLQEDIKKRFCYIIHGLVHPCQF